MKPRPKPTIVPKDSAAALDKLTRAPLTASCVPSAAVRDLLAEFIGLSEMPAAIKARYVDAPDLLAVRRDMGMRTISFLIRAGEAHYLRLFIRTMPQSLEWISLDNKRVDSCYLVEGRVDIAMDRIDETVFSSDRPLPIVHRFAARRVWDSFLQTIKVAVDERERGRSHLTMMQPTGRQIANAALMFPRAGIDVTVVDAQVRQAAHIVEHIADTQISPLMVDLAKRMLPPPNPAANGLFISFEVEKVRWVNQADVMAGFINALVARGDPPAKIVVNGMTGPWDGVKSANFHPKIRAEENRLIAALCAKLSADIPVMSMFGDAFEDKAAAIAQCNFFIAGISSASLIPNLMDIAGVTFGNPPRLKWDFWPDSPMIARVPLEFLQVREDAAGLGAIAMIIQGRRAHGYAIAPEDFVPFALEHYAATRGADTRAAMLHAAAQQPLPTTKPFI